MIIREAKIEDIPPIQRVRNSVTENTLSSPDAVTDKACEEFITIRGKGWVCEMEQQIVGFAIADLIGNNIWALFVDPNYQGKRIGRILHQTMMDWYFTKTKDKVWLGTGSNTRAVEFYKRLGWKEVGAHGSDEIKFEMSCNDWMKSKKR